MRVGSARPKIFLIKALDREKETKREALLNLNKLSSIPAKPVASWFCFYLGRAREHMTGVAAQKPPRRTSPRIFLTAAPRGGNRP